MIHASDITHLIAALQGMVGYADHSLPNRICIQIVTLFVEVFVTNSLVDFSEAETIEFTASNGDSVQAKGMGQAIEDRTPGMFNVVQVYTITGGTGQFAGASGPFTLKRLVSQTVGVASSTLEEYILIPWAWHSPKL